MKEIQSLLELALSAIDDEFGTYNIEILKEKLDLIIRPGMKYEEIRESLIQVSLELTTDMEPDWQKGAAKLYVHKLYDKVRKNRGLSNDVDLYKNLYGFVKDLVDKNLYGKYILENYSKEDIDELEKEIKPERDFLFTYSGIKLLGERYLVENFNREVLELPQQMFMGIAMHLAIPEKKEKRLYYAKRFYDVLSSLKATMATPTMSNARKPFYQLSSCFIDTVNDSLKGIYKSLDNFSEVSKFGGGMGIYIGKIRALGSPIRGFKGASGGVIPWVKLFNDTAIAVDQLGVRNGSVAIWLDAWHKDIPEFLQVRTNNGDDRKKAHDVFPGLCYPDLFWKMAEEDIDGNWYMMCPHEIKQVKGYSLEDYYGEEWEKRYFDCVNDDRIDKRVMKVKDIVRLIIKSAAETGTPFAFYRDTANKMNPNKHKGMIYSSNLCTEIMQNTKLSEWIEDNKELASKIITNALQAAQRREKIKKINEAEKKKIGKGTAPLAGKVAVCTGRDKEYNEFIVVEGDSAGGSAKQARDRKFQSIMPSKGKIMNTEKQKLENVLASEELKIFNTAIGTGTLDNYSEDDLKYNKIIIMSDADVDGYHIRTLWMTYIYRYMRPLIANGHLYLAQPPLYKVYKKVKGKEISEYAYSDEELEKVKKKIGKGALIQRYKGLGEMNPDQLWETTLNPETRTLLQVTIDDAAKAEKMVSLLMGDVVEPRRKYMYKYGEF